MLILLLIGFCGQESNLLLVMEMPRLPEYIKGKGNYVYTTADGAVGLVIYEFDSAKADEAIEEIIKAYLRLHDVPGFSYQLMPLAKAREATNKNFINKSPTDDTFDYN